jgi:hypothetical protein
MPAFAPTERPESGTEEVVALLFVSLVGAALGVGVGVALAVMACAASLVEADGFESE